MMPPPLILFLIVVCLTLEAFFAGAETGVVSVNKLRIRHQVRKGLRGAKTVEFFLRHPDYMLGTTLVGTNLFQITSIVLAAEFFESKIGPSGPVVSSVVMTLVILIFSEYLPKAWFQSAPSLRTRLFAPLLAFFGYLFYPVGRAITGFTTLVFPGPKNCTGPDWPAITREELRHLTLEVERTGTLDAHERNMIQGVFSLAQTTCGSVCVPLSEMVVVEDDSPLEDVLRLARQRQLRRLPVYHLESGRYVGLLNVLDAVRSPGVAKTVRDIMRPPQFVRADLPVDELLLRVRMTRQPMALVTDPNTSEVIGLVTVDNVLSRVFGRL